MTRDEKIRHRLVVVLTLGTGALDAIGFLHLGGAFSSVMTGNMVLLGLSAASGDTARALLVCIAIGAYIAGVVCGARLTGSSSATDTVWPARVSWALAVEALLLLAFSVMWLQWPTVRPAGLDETMLAIAAVALGIQSSAVQRFGVSGLSSTYLTGTLTTVVAGFASRRPLAQQIPGLAILLALILGAAGGYALSAALPLLAPIAIVGPVAAVTALALLIEWQDSERDRAVRLDA